MEFLSSRELRLNPKGVWKRVRKEKVGVVTLNGKPQFVLTSIEPNEIEEALYLVRRIQAELALENMSRKAKEKGLDKLSSEEINELIKTARAEKNAGRR